MTENLRMEMAMTENEIATIVVDACYHIHSRLGPGLLETGYMRLLEYELAKRGLKVRREVPVPFRYDEKMDFDEGFRGWILSSRGSSDFVN